MQNLKKTNGMENNGNQSLVPLPRYYVVNKYALCLLNYISIWFSYSKVIGSITLSWLTGCHSYFRDIQLTTRDLLSSKVQIFRLRAYTFAIPITPNELHEAEVRLEGMLHLKMYLFKFTDFRTHPIGVSWLRRSTVVCPLVMCDFISVCKWSYRKVMFSWVCLILFIEGMLSEEGTFHMGYTPYPMYLFKLPDFRNHPIGDTWLRKSTVVCPLVMCEFITVLQMKLQEGDVFTGG